MAIFRLNLPLIKSRVIAGVGDLVDPKSIRAAFNSIADWSRRVGSQLNDFRDLLPVDYSSWTPEFTNLDVEDGILTGRSYKIGRLAVIEFSLTFGSATAVTGDITITNVPYGTIQTIYTATCQLVDDGTATHVGLLGQAAAGVGMLVRRQVVSGANVIVGVCGATAPFTWVADDRITGKAVYLTDSD